MRKIGRNDPCYCGSGKKYKRCCMERDEANRVTPIVSGDTRGHRTAFGNDPFDEAKPFDAPGVFDLIEGGLEWENELYRIIAVHLYSRTIEQYEADDVAAVVTLWNAYSREVEPVTRKVGVFAAALEYCLLLIGGYDGETQASLARKYGVAAATISKRADEIMRFAEQHFAGELDFDKFDDEPETPAPHRMAAERTLQDIGKLLENQHFESMEEADAFLNNMIDQPGSRHPAPASNKDRAQDLLYDAWDEPSRAKRVQMAKQALKWHPNSSDAYNILAEDEARNPQETARLYKQGMEAGERDMEPGFMEKNKGYFWGNISTRPYMRAKAGYAEACLALGELEEAAKQFAELLELDPNDHQGARFRLSAVYLEQERYKEAVQLMKTYDEDVASFNFDRVLAEYGLHGRSAKLAQLCRKARKQNSHVVDYLLGNKRLPRKLPDYIGFGDENEAIEYADTHKHLWLRQTELLRWLAEQ